MDKVVTFLDTLPEWLATTLEGLLAVAFWGLGLVLLVVASSLLVL